ncbi:MAG: tRNA 2-thiouridine(34) synthase MnmA [candidate division WOR-3 bacterium]
MRVVVAMSGGVDSSVAALLLKEQGHEVVGVTMMLVDCAAGPKARVPSCCGRQAVRDAQKVAVKLGIPHYTIDFRQQMESEVVADFCREYALGRTPNPCIRCNERLKFRLLLGRAIELGAEKLATGHYARIQADEGDTWRLLRGKDPAKDQSYFLYRVTQEQLAHLVMPLGELTKREVRELAHRSKLPVAEKRESQEVCFVAGEDWAGFLKQRSPELFRPGKVVDTQGRILGEHKGVAHYTVGQRKGLGIAFGERRYIVGLRPETNEVVIGIYEEALSKVAELEQVHWISGREPSGSIEVAAKIRSQHEGGFAVVEPAGVRATMRFREPQFAVTPGQAAVFYQGDMVLGGGVIRVSG